MIAPYLWFPGVHGTIGGPNEQLGFSASPGDLLSHFRFGLMGVVEPRYKRVLLPLDIFWVRLGDDRAIDNIPTPTVANLKASEFVLTPKVGYRLIDLDRVKVDALVGLRYWHFGQSVSFTTTTLNFSNSQNWVDPVVGGRITGILTPKFQVTIAGDDGGWGTGSQQDYQVFGAVGYRFKPRWTLQVGYRYLFTNYRSGIRFLNIATSGVLIGVSINLK
jgi:outer membrane receptor protein involved in Fe transport